MKTLLIVESATKARKIQGYLGDQYRVIASCGHIRDLDTKNGIDVANRYKPSYVISKDKKKVVVNIKKAASQCREVLIGTDDDREGMAIGWHIARILKLNIPRTKRIVFHEVTKKALRKAVQNPTNIDMNMVNAQQARRILDMLLGFELSPLLAGHFQQRGLSAGRVQSVVNRMIVEREAKIADFSSDSYYQVDGAFVPEPPSKARNPKKPLPDQMGATLTNKLKEHDDAFSLLQHCGKSKTKYTVADKQLKDRKSQPQAPFETCTMQQVAGRLLNMSTKNIMKCAQNLYQEGYITYHRTDSTELSEESLDKVAEWIISNCGEEYYRRKQYKTKSTDAQEGHQAIRPTEIDRVKLSDEMSAPERRLYEIIWKRTVASQMAPAVYEVVNLEITISGRKERFHTTAERIIFDGYLRVYPENQGDQKMAKRAVKMLKRIQDGAELFYHWMRGTQKFTKPQGRFTEPTLVKQLKKLKIGRPSTYATTISRVQERGYAERKSTAGKVVPVHILELTDELKQSQSETKMGAEKNKLMPTDLGIAVNDYLCSHFEAILDYAFTAKMEKELDKIAGGKSSWVSVVDMCYKTFHPVVVELNKLIKPAPGGGKYPKVEKRLVGTHAATGLPMLAYKSKNGPVLQIGSDDLPKEQRKYINISAKEIKSLTEAQANTLKLYPMKLGVHEGTSVVLKNGRYGEYITCGDTSVNLKDFDGDITLAKAVELLSQKKEKGKNVLKRFKGKNTPVVMNGQ